MKSLVKLPNSSNRNKPPNKANLSLSLSLNRNENESNKLEVKKMIYGAEKLYKKYLKENQHSEQDSEAEEKSQSNVDYIIDGGSNETGEATNDYEKSNENNVDSELENEDELQTNDQAEEKNENEIEEQLELLNEETDEEQEISKGDIVYNEEMNNKPAISDLMPKLANKSLTFLQNNVRAQISLTENVNKNRQTSQKPSNKNKKNSNVNIAFSLNTNKKKNDKMPNSKDLRKLSAIFSKAKTQVIRHLSREQIEGEEGETRNESDSPDDENSEQEESQSEPAIEEDDDNGQVNEDLIQNENENYNDESQVEESENNEINENLENNNASNNIGNSSISNGNLILKINVNKTQAKPDPTNPNTAAVLISTPSRVNYSKVESKKKKIIYVDINANDDENMRQFNAYYAQSNACSDVFLFGKICSLFREEKTFIVRF